MEVLVQRLESFIRAPFNLPSDQFAEILDVQGVVGHIAELRFERRFRILDDVPELELVEELVLKLVDLLAAVFNNIREVLKAILALIDQRRDKRDVFIAQR